MSKRKRPFAPALVTARWLLSPAGRVSAAGSALTPDIRTRNRRLSHEITFHEEEISDVRLGTFYVFDKDKVGTLRRGLKLAQGCGGCGCGH